MRSRLPSTGRRNATPVGPGLQDAGVTSADERGAVDHVKILSARVRVPRGPRAGGEADQADGRALLRVVRREDRGEQDMTVELLGRAVTTECSGSRFMGMSSRSVSAAGRLA